MGRKDGWEMYQVITMAYKVRGLEEDSVKKYFILDA